MELTTCHRRSSGSGFFVSAEDEAQRDKRGLEYSLDTHSTADTVDGCDEYDREGYSDRYFSNTVGNTSSYPSNHRFLNACGGSSGNKAAARYGSPQREISRNIPRSRSSAEEGLSSVQGNTTATVRALKELARHERFVNTAVQELQR